jgi:hypothetical protein
MPTRTCIHQATIDFGLSLDFIRTFDKDTWKSALSAENPSIALLVKALMVRVSAADRLRTITENRYRFALSLMNEDQVRKVNQHDLAMVPRGKLKVMQDVFESLIQECS